jgi:hypothetical protein
MAGNVRYDEYVKAPNEEHEYTPEQIREVVKCKADVMYFITHYIHIVHQDTGVQLFDPYDYQVDLIDKFIDNRFNVCMLSRQSGKSTIVAAFALWFACFHGHKNIGIVSNKAEAAKNFLSRLKYMYELLPAWLKPGVPGWAQTTIEFDNHTKIYIAATSKDSFRGEPMGMLICDEFAFVEPSWKADEFWASNYPTISASRESKIIIISTPNGLYNKFHEIYTKAEEGKNTFTHSRYDYRAVPGRDDEWAEEQRQNLGNIKFQQEFGCEFIGSSETIIDAKAIERLLRKRKEPESYDMGGKFRIWEKPKQGASYVLGVDTSKGVGGDSSVIQVIKVLGINPVQLRQVAVWEDNYTDVYKFAEVVNRMSYYYNDAYMMVENNAEGSVVVQRLWWEYENEYLINTGGKIKDLGIRATGNTKPRAVFLMKKIIEDQMITICDDKTVGQLADFQDLGNNKFGGVNINDDCVSSLYWAIFILEMNIYDESWTFSEENTSEEDFWGDIFGDWVDEVEREADWSWLTEK